MKTWLPQPADPDSLIISYLTLRKVVGLLGVSLVPVMVLGSFLLDHTSYIQISVSAYYHTHMRNPMVGIICGIALFLLSYHGYKWYDSLSSKLAGIFALCIAFFPTSESSNKEDLISKLHYLTAGMFFAILAGMSIFLFTKSAGDMTPEKKKRNRVYRICGIVMAASVAGIPICGFSAIHDHIKWIRPTLILETLALVSFGISWLTKGEFLLKDR